LTHDVYGYRVKCTDIGSDSYRCRVKMCTDVGADVAVQVNRIKTRVESAYDVCNHRLN